MTFYLDLNSIWEGNVALDHILSSQQQGKDDQLCVILKVKLFLPILQRDHSISL